MIANTTTTTSRTFSFLLRRNGWQRGMCVLGSDKCHRARPRFQHAVAVAPRQLELQHAAFFSTSSSSKKSSHSSHNENKKTAKKKFSYSPHTWRRTAGNLLSAVGFMVSSFATARSGSFKFQQRIVEPAKELMQFLQTTGVELELSQSLNRRLMGNLIILNRIQRLIINQENEKESHAPRSSLSSSVPPWDKALRYMKFATAAYGKHMIRAAELDATGRLDPQRMISSGEGINMEVDVMAHHIGNLHMQDIHVFDPAIESNDDLELQDVSDVHLLRHFVAVDHSSRKIVLSIRGTFSMSEVMVDVTAFSREFCDGEAHSEMATMAEGVWRSAEETVGNLLKQYPTFDLVITGHSLGAGTACLLHVLLWHKRQQDPLFLDSRKIECFAFAAPPVFHPVSSLHDEVLASCTQYIHEKDVVPFLSVHTIRQLFSLLNVVETYPWTRRERFGVMFGSRPPSSSLVDEISNKANQELEHKEGCPPLAVPAQYSILLQHDPPPAGTIEEDDLNWSCTPKVLDWKDMVGHLKTRRFGPFELHEHMGSDHVPPRYEHALSHLSGNSATK